VEYFLLSYEIKDTGEFFAALDSSGNALITSAKSDLSGVSHVYLRATKREKINDIAPAVGNELILSKKAADCLRQHCRFCEAMLSFPTTIYRGATSQIVSSDYVFWWSSKEHGVLDIHASQIRYYKKHILTVSKWVVRRDLLPGFDIFLGPTNKWLVSSAFKNVCFEWGLTGFRFKPIEMN
jgi:hypothetical protein